MKHLTFIALLLFLSFSILSAQTYSCSDAATISGAALTDQATAVAAFTGEDVNNIATSTNCHHFPSNGDVISCTDGNTHQFCYEYTHAGGLFAIESQLAIPASASCLNSTNTTLTKQVFAQGNCTLEMPNTGNTTSDGWNIYSLDAGVYKICTTVTLDDATCCGEMEGICTYTHTVCPAITAASVSSTELCLNENVSLSLTAGTNLPSATTDSLVWKYSTTSGFDPYTSGTVIGKVNLTGTLPAQLTTSFGTPSLCGNSIYVKGILGTTLPDSCKANAQTQEFQIQFTCPEPTIAETDNSGIAANDSIICQGSAVGLSVNETFTSYAWSTSETTQSINPTPTTSTQYTVTVTNANNCTATKTIDITVTDTVALTDPNISICASVASAYDLTQHNSTVASTGTIVWYTGNPATGTAITTPTEVDLSSNPDLWVQVTENGCSSVLDVSSTIHNNPSATISGQDTICQGETATLTAPTGTGFSYNWSNGLTSNSITSSFAGVYMVTVTDANTCTASDTITVVVNPLPSVIVSAAADPVCAGGTIQFNMTGTANAIVYYTQGTNSSSVTLNATGEGSVSATAESANATITLDSIRGGVGNCLRVLSGASSTATVSITIAPDAGTNGSLNVCGSGTANKSIDIASALGGTPNTGGTWINADAASVDISNISNVNFNGVSAGTYDFLYIVLGQAPCANDTATVSVTVNNAPAITVDSTTCAANRTTFDVALTTDAGVTITSDVGTVVDNGSGSWTITGVTASTIANITATNATTTCVDTISATNACPCLVVDTPTQPSVDTICDGETIPQLSVVVGANQTANWYDVATGGTALATNVTSYTPTTATIGTVTYYVETYDITSDCTSDTRTEVSLTVHSNPTATADTLRVCDDNTDGIATFTLTDADTDVLNGQTGMTVSYHGTLADANAGTNALTSPYGNVVANQQTIYARVENANGCHATSEVVLTVNPKPVFTLNSTDNSGSIPNNNTVCLGDSATITVSLAGQTYAWATGATTQDITVAPTQTTMYFVTVTDANGCMNNDSLQIAVDTLPVTSFSFLETSGTTNNDGVICNGDNIEITATATGVSYAWSTGTGAQFVTVSPTADSTFAVTITNLPGCSATYDTLVTVHSNPVANIDTLQVCDDNTDGIATFTLTAADTDVLNGQTGMTVSYHATLADANAGTNALSSSYDNVVANQQTIYVRVLSASGCFATGEIVLIVNPKPVFTLSSTDNSGSIPNNSAVCLGDSATITVSLAGETYAWSSSDTTQQITIAPTDTTTYTVTVTDANMCSTTAEHEIIVNALPSAAIQVAETSGTNSNDGNICNGSTVTLTAETSLNYLWSTGGSTAAITVAPVADSTFALTVTDAIGCVANNSVAIQVLEETRDTIQYVGCQGDGYSATINGVTYSESNTNGQDTLTNANGCDSIITIIFTFRDTSSTNIDYVGCQGDGHTVTVGTMTFDEANPTGAVVLSNTNGCDSTINVNLVFQAPSTGTETYAGCQGDGYTVTVGTVVYDENNPTGTEVLQNAAGCDSTVTINLVYHSATDSTITRLGCQGDGYEVIVGSSTYNQTNPNGVDTLVNVNGCDSIVTTALIFNALTDSTLVHAGCQGDGYEVTVNGTVYSETNPTGTEVLQNAAGCDSTVTINFVYNMPSDSTITYTGCQQDGYSIVVNGNLYSETNPTGTEVLQNAAGCDSTITINLVYNDKNLRSELHAGCQGDGYEVTVNGTVYNEGNPTGTETMQNAAGCDSVVVVNLTYNAPSTGTLDYVGCQGDGHFVIINGNTYNETNPTGTEILQNAAGCDSTVTINFVYNQSSTGTVTYQGCEGDGYAVTVNGVVYNENKPIGTETMQNAVGCDSVVTINLVFNPTPQANISGATTICTQTSTQITAAPGYASYQWSDNLGNTPTVVISNPQTYYITITDAQGCVGVDSVVIVDSALEINAVQAEDYNGFGVSCAGGSDGEATVQFVQGGNSSYVYAWSNGATTSTATGLAANVQYFVTVTDAALGCQATASITLTEPTSFTVFASHTNPTCYGDLDGGIVVDSVTGGSVGGYTYTIDPDLGYFNVDSTFTDLVAGTYTLTTQDANGCRVAQQIQIENPEQPYLSLGEDITINLGDSVQLNALTNLPDTIISWNPPTGLSCSDCLNPFVQPMQDVIYQLTVTDSSGCSASDQIIINVLKNREVFIPNAFTPNETGTNDFFTVYGSGQVAQVTEFYVYDRWGELVHSAKNFPVNSQEHGWNGFFKGQKMNTGVFIYYVKVQYLDGKVEEFKGDVTLLR